LLEWRDDVGAVGSDPPQRLDELLAMMLHLPIRNAQPHDFDACGGEILAREVQLAPAKRSQVRNFRASGLTVGDGNYGDRKVVNSDPRMHEAPCAQGLIVRV